LTLGAPHFQPLFLPFSGEPSDFILLARLADLA
jgi:hypothetical protein